MTDIIVKIVVEVISILGIVTKEIGQRRISMLFLVDTSPTIDCVSDDFPACLPYTNPYCSNVLEIIVIYVPKPCLE